MAVACPPGRQYWGASSSTSSAKHRRLVPPTGSGLRDGLGSVVVSPCHAVTCGMVVLAFPLSILSRLVSPFLIFPTALSGSSVEVPPCRAIGSIAQCQLESSGESDATVGTVLTILPSLLNETGTQVSPGAMSSRCGATCPSCCKGIFEAEVGLGGSTPRRCVRVNLVCRST